MPKSFIQIRADKIEYKNSKSHNLSHNLLVLHSSNTQLHYSYSYTLTLLHSYILPILDTPILHTFNLTHFQSYILPILHFSNLLLFQSCSISILLTSNPSRFQSCIFPIIQSSNPTSFQSYTLLILHSEHIKIIFCLQAPVRMQRTVCGRGVSLSQISEQYAI